MKKLAYVMVKIERTRYEKIYSRSSFTNNDSDEN